MNVNLILQYQVRIFVIKIRKRESGVNPERTGHCKQGVSFKIPLHYPNICEKVKRAMICKSGNLPGIEMCSRYSANIRKIIEQVKTAQWFLLCVCMGSSRFFLFRYKNPNLYV